jgi:hypothetical protein
MQRNRDLRFCMEQLSSMLDRDEYEPEQKRTLEAAQKRLRGLARKTNPGKPEIYRVVRQVAEAILNTLKRD